jgi:hypothetical protein
MDNNVGLKFRGLLKACLGKEPLKKKHWLAPAKAAHLQKFFELKQCKAISILKALHHGL